MAGGLHALKHTRAQETEVLGDDAARTIAERGLGRALAGGIPAAAAMVFSMGGCASLDRAARASRSSMPVSTD